MHKPILEQPLKQPLRIARGFTLIELLIVMVILGLLASLVGPRLFGQLGASKIKAARTQIEMVGAALDTYRLDMSRYPSTEEGLAVLSEKPDDPAKASNWRGPYLKSALTKTLGGIATSTRPPVKRPTTSCLRFGADGQEGGSGDDTDIHSWE